VAALLGALLSPSTWLHKSLAVALCGVLSANPALCTNNAIISQSQEASATNPVKVETTQFSDLLADRSREFLDDTPSPSPNNSKTPSPSRETPNRSSDFLESTNQSQYIRKEFKSPIYAYYINGIRTDMEAMRSQTYAASQLTNGITSNLESIYNYSGVNKNTLDNVILLINRAIELQGYVDNNKITQVGAKVATDIYKTIDSWGLGDLFESFRQVLDWSRPDSDQVVNQVIESIKKHDQEEKNKASQSCEDTARAKFLIIGHSQGTLFLQDVAQKLPPEYADRTLMYAIAPFTHFGRISGKVRISDYLLRPDDFPSMLNHYLPDIKQLLSFVVETAKVSGVQGNTALAASTLAASTLAASILVSAPDTMIPAGGANLGYLTPVEDRENRLKHRAMDSHSINNYLGIPSKPEYASEAKRGLERAKASVGALLNFDSGKYEKKKQCSQPQQQPSQVSVAISKATTNAASEVKRVRNCRVNMKLPGGTNPGACVIQGSVMTAEGMVDGSSTCGQCNLFIGDLPPHKGSCKTRPITDRPTAFELGTPVPCPSNWDSGW